MVVLCDAELLCLVIDAHRSTLLRWIVEGTYNKAGLLMHIFQNISLEETRGIAIIQY